MEKKIIKFPNKKQDCKNCSSEIDNYQYGDYEDLEEWEADICFINKQDWTGLVEYREKVSKQRPDDLYIQWRLGEAYILNGEYEKAIKFLSTLHQEYPDFVDVQHSLLDALFAIGKNENDYNWIEKPNVIRLNKDVLDFCYEFLRPKRKPRAVFEIYTEILYKGYLKFNEEELLNALNEDGRFEISSIKLDIIDSKVSVVRKKK